MRSALVVPIVIVGVVVAGAAYLVMSKGSSSDAPLTTSEQSRTAPLTEQLPATTPAPSVSAIPTPTAPPEEKVVTGRFSGEEEQAGVDTQVFAVEFSASGTEPAKVNAKVGDIVIFRNATTKDIRPTSDAYPFSASAPVQPGDEFQWTFAKVGTWVVTDSLGSKQTTTIVVTK